MKEGGTRRMKKLPVLIRMLHFLLQQGGPHMVDLERAVGWVTDSQFQIKNIDYFKQEILSKIFRYKQFNSFIRQLYKHSFTKIRGNAMIFTHDTFRRGLTLEQLASLRGIRPRDYVKKVSPKYNLGQDGAIRKKLRVKIDRNKAPRKRALVKTCEGEVCITDQITEQKQESQAIHSELTFSANVTIALKWQ